MVVLIKKTEVREEVEVEVTFPVHYGYHYIGDYGGESTTQGRIYEDGSHFSITERDDGKGSREYEVETCTMDIKNDLARYVDPNPFGDYSRSTVEAFEAMKAKLKVVVDAL